METIKDDTDEEISDTLLRRSSTSSYDVDSPSNWHYSPESVQNLDVTDIIDLDPLPKFHCSSASDNYEDIDGNNEDKIEFYQTDEEIDKDIDVENENKIEFYQSDEEIKEVDQSISKYSTFENQERSSRIRNSSSDFDPISSRLIFEDDFDDFVEVQMRAIVADGSKAIPNRCLLGTPSTEFKPNSLILGSQKIEKHVEYPESVPYDTLMKTEICECRYCGRCFINR